MRKVTEVTMDLRYFGVFTCIAIMQNEGNLYAGCAKIGRIEKTVKGCMGYKAGYIAFVEGYNEAISEVYGFPEIYKTQADAAKAVARAYATCAALEAFATVLQNAFEVDAELQKMEIEASVEDLIAAMDIAEVQELELAQAGAHYIVTMYEPTPAPDNANMDFQFEDFAAPVWAQEVPTQAQCMDAAQGLARACASGAADASMDKLFSFLVAACHDYNIQFNTICNGVAAVVKPLTEAIRGRQRDIQLDVYLVVKNCIFEGLMSGSFKFRGGQNND